MHYQEAIKHLKEANLETCSYEYIDDLLNQIGPFGAVCYSLNPGDILLRCRQNFNDEHFTTREHVSYKPQQYNNNYQRASTPKRTMFYAGVIPSGAKENDVRNARFVAALESSNCLRNNIDGEETLTFSKWMVTETIQLLAICHHQDFLERNSYTAYLYEEYKKWLNENHSAEMIEKSRIVTNYLANEYSKKVNEGEFYKYKISAIFSEKTVKKGLSGIFYPSIKADAKGFCVAISPETIDSRLKVQAVGECTLYKQGRHTIIDNETICEISNDCCPFVMKPVDTKSHVGREIILRKLKIK